MFINNYVAVTMYVIEYSNNIFKFFEFAICRDLYFVMMTEKLKKNCLLKYIIFNQGNWSSIQYLIKLQKVMKPAYCI